MRVRPTYTEEFKADAVALLKKSDRPARETAGQGGSRSGPSETGTTEMWLANPTRRSGF
jgi:hypothetical protein